MNHNFTMERSKFNLCFRRREQERDMQSALPYLDDVDMKELLNRTIGKLQNMTNEEFEQLELIEAE